MTYSLSPRQMQSLRAACDALIPSLRRDDDPHRFFATGALDLGVPERVAELIAALPNAATRNEIGQLLAALANPAANIALSGTARPFHQMSIAKREATLRRWAVSKLFLRRKAFQALKRLATFAYYTQVDEEGSSPALRGIGYPGPLSTLVVGERTLKLTEIAEDSTLDCDAVVVGSGAGGGVVAAKLAAAGKQVIVLEMGGYYAEADFTWRERDGLANLYLEGGMCQSRDLGMMILAGRALGGGTLVNYSTSFATPDGVREEWAGEHGLPQFTTAAYSRALAEVSARSGVSTAYNTPSCRDRKLAEGLQKLKLHSGLMPRNVRDCSQAEDCGYCVYGCRRGAKQSTMKTFLQDANDAGAQIVVNCQVERVTIQQGRATGVEATVRNASGTYKLRVRAKAVVVAGGSLHSPALLLRSGLSNPNIGRHLHLHPCTGVWGRFSEPVNPWGGVMQAVYSDEYANQDGRGYGVKLETAPVHPSVLLVATAWESGEQHKSLMAQYPHLTPIGLLTRDIGSGRVSLDRAGQPVVDYKVSPFDWAHIRPAIEGAAKILAAAGAEEVFSTQSRYVNWLPASQPLEGFLRRVDAADYGPLQMGFLSYHQMGSCRMGDSPRRSVVNPQNESHEVRGLFVTDASTFPSASGVNPMLTIMAIAACAGEVIVSKL